ncbi:hypothetical protein E3P86_02316 [Wallemia ichthyophaga]|uniref:BZIP domain-containing protein n=1 Tax=Wallemia ichthyophaga TaxID=245174 RepID=A0A4T0J9Z6_WALIC|nr:hypothetical protein E3P86_02316 [Wallemia ichthyophaga]
MDLDFLEMLKQQVGNYGNNNGDNKLFDSGINPNHLTDLPNLVATSQFPDFKSEYNENPTPPLTNNDTSSPESSHSQTQDKDKDSDKRKASDELLDNEQHTSKSTNNRRSSDSSSELTRNSKPNSTSKRKEQNRAAQRAFRERKEKHVKVLEDKVAAQAEENTNLKDLLSRLQQENMTLKHSAFTFQFPPPQSNSNSRSFHKSPSPLPNLNSAAEYRDNSSNLNNTGAGVLDDFLNDFGLQNDFMFDQNQSNPSIPSPSTSASLSANKKPPSESIIGPPPTILELAQALSDPEERLKCPQVKSKMEQMGIVQSHHEDVSKISPYLIQEIKRMVEMITNENNEPVDAVVRRTWKDLGKDIPEQTFDLDDLCSQLTAKATCGVSSTECQAKFLSVLAQQQNKSAK